MRQDVNIEEATGMLSPYRVLDLTDEKGFLCGKLMGDLGADVIKVERPGGDSSRNIGPFYKDIPEPEKSLVWLAFNSNKRGITLDIEREAGQVIFKKLVKTADFIIESFPPGYLDSLGLGYGALEEINKRIILVSITPFGSKGPYRDYLTSDIIAWAMGGQMYLWGDEDRPPIRISYHSHAYMHAASEAAAAAMMALFWRNRTGEGQQVDVSIHECVTAMTMRTASDWDMNREIKTRKHDVQRTGLALTHMWPCKDGFVTFYFGSGMAAKKAYHGLQEWMREEGLEDDFLCTFDLQEYDMLTASQETIDKLEESAGRFFMRFTKKEIFENTVKRRLFVYPVGTAQDFLESPQLSDRNFWVEVNHPELGTSIKYPRPVVRNSETICTIHHRAPLIGEHNEEIYIGELSMSRGVLLQLEKDGII